MALRTVTGQFMRAGHTPWAFAEVWFTLQKGSYSLLAHYPADSLKAVTDANGRFEVGLWISEEAQSRTHWLCRQPNGETFKFGVPAGIGAISIEALRALGSPPVVASPSLSGLIDSRIAQHNADGLAHVGLGGGGPGSATRLVGQADLVGSKAVLLHSLTTIELDVQVLDTDGELLLPWRPLSSDYVEIDFAGLLPLTQTYTVIIKGY
jgi:hypothetical protein